MQKPIENIQITVKISVTNGWDNKLGGVELTKSGSFTQEEILEKVKSLSKRVSKSARVEIKETLKRKFPEKLAEENKAPVPDDQVPF